MADLTFKAATYKPTAPYTGEVGPSLLRLKNMILTGIDDLLYLQCYKGSLDLSETIPTGPLTGTISGSLNGTTITGAGTVFKTELRSGQFVFAGADLLVVNEIVSNTVLTIYRALTTAIGAGTTGYRLPILFEIGRKRGTLLQGNGYEFDKGNIVATGEGTMRVNGSTLNATMALTRKPRIAIYNPGAGTYTVKNLGLIESAVAPTIASVAGGVKNMQIGHYSLLLVPSRSSMNGAGNPGPKTEFDIAAPGNVAEVDVTAVTVDSTDGQEGFDVYASLSTQGGIQGPWFFLETVLISSIVGNKFKVEWEDSQIGRTGNEVDYDNDPPPEAAFIGTIVGYAIAVGCNGKFGGTPGPSIVPAKPGNVDAWPAEWNVTSSPPEVILGIATALARLYLLTPKSLQQAQYTPSGNSQVPPVTMRPYWHIGFANGYQVVFIAGMLVGYSIAGPVRSVESANASDADQYELGAYVSSITKDWVNGHVLVEYDPDPEVNAVCFFHSADSQNTAGFWRTRVLIWGLRQTQWIGDVFIESDTRDMVVTGVAQVDGSLEFLAGGRYGAVRQVETATVVGTVTGSGNATVIITAAGMAGSPKTISVPLLLGDTASIVAGRIRTALAADSAVNAFFIVGGTGVSIVLTSRLTAANDATVNIDIDNGTCTGLTTAHTSANSTAGVAGSVQVDTFRWNTVTSGSVNYFAAWQLTNANTPKQDKELKAIQVSGKFTAGTAQVYGYTQTDPIPISNIEAGTGSLSGSISLGSQTSPETLERVELNVSNAGLFTPRVGGTWDGTGDPDRIDKVVIEYQPLGMPR